MGDARANSDDYNDDVDDDDDVHHQATYKVCSTKSRLG